MSHRQASDASLAEIAQALGSEVRHYKRAIREHRHRIRLIRARLASIRVECKKRGIVLHDAH